MAGRTPITYHPSPRYGILARDSGVPTPASFDDSLLGRVVDVDHPEALPVAPCPLEVIEQGPDEIPAERHAVSDRAVGLQQMLMQERLALWVIDLPIRDDIVARGAVFGDQEPARAVIVADPLQDLIETRRIGLPTHCGDIDAGRHDPSRL